MDSTNLQRCLSTSTSNELAPTKSITSKILIGYIIGHKFVHVVFIDNVRKIAFFNPPEDIIKHGHIWSDQSTPHRVFQLKKSRMDCLDAHVKGRIEDYRNFFEGADNFSSDGTVPDPRKNTNAGVLHLSKCRNDHTQHHHTYF